ncbi:MAG: DUF5715 family protein [Bacteroidota bacterium]
MTRKSKKTILFILLIGALIVAAVLYKYRRPILQRLRYNSCSIGNYGLTYECPGCAEYFPDVVAVMEQAYRSEKIEPQEELTDLDALFDRGVLVEIPCNSRYGYDRMDHSRPYVLPVVLPFLNDLVTEYEKNLRQKNLSYIPFIITSGTRSITSANALTEENGIARTQSHHLLGKTIDISYKRFGDHRAEQRCFIEALHRLRDRDRCYVKYEQSGALHLTVR